MLSREYSHLPDRGRISSKEVPLGDCTIVYNITNNQGNAIKNGQGAVI